MAWIRNTSSYPGEEVRDLVKLATRGVNMSRVCVNVKGGRSFRGRAYSGIPSISNAPASAEYLVTITLGKDGRRDEPKCYGGRSPDDVGPGNRFPFFTFADWREQLIHIASHEARHIHQFRHGKSRSEVDCEHFAEKALERYRARGPEAGVIQEEKVMASPPAPHKRDLPALADEIRREHEAVEAGIQATVTAAIRCGELLAEAKSEVQHGDWYSWLEQNFPSTPKTAAAYMRLAANRDQIERAGSIRGALKQLAAPAGSAIPKVQAEPKRGELYEITTERKRRLAEKAKERLWNAITLVGALRWTPNQDLDEVLYLDRALAVSNEQEIKDMIGELTAGMKGTRKLRAELESRLMQEPD